MEQKSEKLEARAVARYLRMSPYKARQVADLIRGKTVSEALAILSNTNRKAAVKIQKTLKSAVANVVNIPEAGKADTDTWIVGKICIDEGPTMKRIRPRAMGRAFRIRRRTSHIMVVIAEPK
ncbi:MAG: 50S ribosomal protein L22 [Candidatus Delongbacteria bacterium]|nr:50S ribosomal protein L22 [Candidatus Delongbacteria bacterium]